MRITLSLFAVLLLFSISSAAQAAENFESWLNAFSAEAKSKGISPELVDRALQDVKSIPRIIELDRKQPEGTMTFAKYKKRVISDARIRKGREMYRKHRAELERAAEKYGVPAQYLVALWGIETSYGGNTGGFGVIPALATLAHDGRRSAYFRGELINALKILDEGHIDLRNMKGSWAGAMGQNQFMPSSFKTFAVDGNNDGRRDIWTSLPDVFASSANYLSRHGWKEEERWGRAVKLPEEFPKSLTGLDTTKSLQQWQNMGVRLPNGGDLPIVAGMQASVVAPDGVNGPVFLAYDNFRVIMRWNKSTYFASSVGILADAIATAKVSQ